MKIINTHCHLIEIEKALGKAGDMEIINAIPAFEKADKTIGIVNEEELLKQMDEAGISQTVLFACECPIIYSSNNFVESVCQKYPDRLIGFASVNPFDSNSPERLEKAVKEQKMKGLKFHPPLQNFFPNDKRVFPVYEMAQQLEIPVVFHVGTTPFGQLSLLSQAYPILLDEVACKFPKMKIILTHLGTLWHNEAFMVTEKNPNVYIDTAAYPYEIKDLMTYNLVRRVGEDKFLFGTDFPMPYEDKSHTMLDFVSCIQELELPDRIKEKIFAGNFECLMEGL